MQQTFIEILRSSVDERRALFETVAAHLGTQAANVEKDLYVCWVLDFLFNRRGGRSDRSVFQGRHQPEQGLWIDPRFSEDIDIGIYKADLHVPLEATSPPCPRSTSSNGARREGRRGRAAIYLRTAQGLLTKEIASVEKAAEQPAIFRWASALIFTATRKRSTFWCSATRASSSPQAAMCRRQSASRAVRVPIPSRLSRARSCPTSLPRCQVRAEPHRSERDDGEAGADLLGERC
jgi:hypothetical protein